MIQFITDTLPRIAASINLIFIAFIILNDIFDLTNEKCECGFKNDNKFDTPKFAA
jgi:hypothetical protein